jgi:hypothetical protein
MPVAIILLSFIFVSLAQATARFEKYSSVARNKDSQIAYREDHHVEFASTRVQNAKTVYLDSNKKPIGEMNSDFSKKITLPDYTYADLRNGSSHGIRLNNNKIALWRKDKDKKEESREFDESQFKADTLIVGCQGLHYYLIENMDQIRSRKKIPVAYFMPGKLDYYNFTLTVEKEDDQFLYLNLSINNLIFKMFTSSLKMKYRKSDRRLVEYSGLSNITDDKNQLQNVVIEYAYDSQLKETL